MKITMVHFGMLAGMVLFSGVASAQSTTITGSGTLNYVPKFTGTTKIGNSQIVDNGTKVGIGTGSTAPRAKLDVWLGQLMVTGSGRNGTLVLDTVGGTSLIGTNTNTNGIAITVNGNVGIGTATPTMKLDVRDANGGFTALNPLDGSLELASGDNGHSFIDFRGSSQLAADYRGRIGYSDGSGFEVKVGGGLRAVQISEAGNVGIGTAAPTQKLDVAGNVQAYQVFQTGASRQKNDIQPLDNAAGRLDCLSGVSYRAKGSKGGEGSQLGLIGEDVEACFPELVATDAEGEKTIDYARLVVPLIEAAKEQQLINQELEARLARIEARVK